MSDWLRKVLAERLACESRDIVAQHGSGKNLSMRSDDLRVEDFCAVSCLQIGGTPLYAHREGSLPGDEGKFGGLPSEEVERLEAEAVARERAEVLKPDVSTEATRLSPQSAPEVKEIYLGRLY